MTDRQELSDSLGDVKVKIRIFPGALAPEDESGVLIFNDGELCASALAPWHTLAEVVAPSNANEEVFEWAL